MVELYTHNTREEREKKPGLTTQKKEYVYRCDGYDGCGRTLSANIYISAKKRKKKNTNGKHTDFVEWTVRTQAHEPFE